MDEAEHFDDDELSRRIVDSAKRKGIDPAQHGVLVPVKPAKPKWTDLAHDYEDKHELTLLIEDEKAEIAHIEENVENLRYAGGMGISTMLVAAVVGAPLWLALLIGASFFGGIRMQRSDA